MPNAQDQTLKPLTQPDQAPASTWIDSYYPLKQIVITLQGAQTTKIEAVIAQLDIVKTRLLNGECAGFENDDEFGYGFEVEHRSNRLSFYPSPTDPDAR